ncbi:S9 family peptidase [Saccharopolyspora taberi]|uniref:Peptidase S9 prolyl oligopeptidase catalytic domain-containing protein n=1 Tax=Saccharopolyspora taberi TaxID=60895 RepID=A0ABN3V1W8_9PSEU
MNTLRGTATDLAPVRSNFGFAPGGRRMACVRTRGRDTAFEVWDFDSGTARLRHEEPSAGRAGQAQPLGDDRVLLLPKSGERRPLTLLERDGRRRVLHEPTALGGYLLPGPDSSSLGLLITHESAAESVVWRVGDRGAEAVVRLPGAASGGVWLDARRELLAVNLTSAPGVRDGVLVDLRQRCWRTLLSLSPDSSDRVIAFHPATGLLVVETNAGGPERFGWARLDGANTVRFPDSLRTSEHRHTALAVDPSGNRILVQRYSGAVSTLHVYRPDHDRLEPLAIPAGVTRGPAQWSRHGIRLPFTSPTQPTTLLTIAPRRQPSVLPGDAGPRDWAGAELVPLNAAAGEVEAIVYGSDWARADRLVLALHGGPLSSWRMEFEPLFQDLTAAGICVVAPNYRGSTGYGRAHLDPVIGAWGGPDLDDVVAIAADLGSKRAGLPPPMVLGVSYGAFLALLAASAAPHMWSACVALAPLLSGARLHSAGAPWVGRRAAKLGALEEIDDDLGTRDVLRLCPSISAPLLLMHGTDDEVIPVEQSRALRNRLLESGAADRLDYRELPAGHHEVVTGRSGEVRDAVTRFCGSWGRA